MTTTDFDLSYTISPIVLVGGVASAIQGTGSLPILSILQSNTYDTGILSTGVGGPDGFFARFRVLPGGNLIDNQFGMYPFANQAVAANAVIVQPLRVSLLMLCPATFLSGGYDGKSSIMGSLKATLDQHTSRGGTYNVATPSYIYQDCLLASLTDVTQGEGKQAQVAWQWDFVKPLLTQADATYTYNNLMGSAAAQTRVTNTAWSSPSNNASGPPVVPAGKSLADSLSQGVPQ